MIDALSVFESDEWAVLSKLRVGSEPSEDRARSVGASDLLDAERADGYLSRIADKFAGGAPKSVIASQFAKRYSYFAIVPGLYAMTMFNKGMDVSIANCSIESREEGQAWLPYVRLRDWRVTTPGSDRAVWRDDVLRSIFAGHVTRVLHALAKSARMPIPVFWENAAVYVYWLYEKRILEAANLEQQGRIRDDYAYLLSAPAALFGESYNPLAKFDTPKLHVANSEQPIRIRQTCCRYYDTEVGASYCSTCPIIHRSTTATNEG